MHDPKAVRFKWLQSEEEGEIITNIKINKLRGVVYLTQKGGEWDSEIGTIPFSYVSTDILDSNFKIALEIAEQTKQVKDYYLTYNNVNTLRIVERDTYAPNSRGTHSLSLLKNDNIEEIDIVNNKEFLRRKHIDYDLYSLVDYVYIYVKGFEGEHKSDGEIIAAMAITFGHELFIHYYKELIDKWSQKNYSIIDMVDREGGVEDHSDYINKNLTKVGVKTMYEYLNSIKQIGISNTPNKKSIFTQEEFERALKYHDKTYINLNLNENSITKFNYFNIWFVS